MQIWDTEFVMYSYICNLLYKYYEFKGLVTANPFFIALSLPPPGLKSKRHNNDDNLTIKKNKKKNNSKLIKCYFECQMSTRRLLIVYYMFPVCCLFVVYMFSDRCSMVSYMFLYCFLFVVLMLFICSLIVV